MPVRPELNDGTSLADLGLPKRLLENFTESGMTTVAMLRLVFTPENLRRVYGLSESAEKQINEALVGSGYPALEFPKRPEKVTRAPGGKKTTPCREKGCEEPRYARYHRCAWHWLAAQPIDVQIAAARSRLAKKEASQGHEYRARVPEKEWPEGRRWCSGCQTFVPLHYTRDSRCRACASQAAYASHIKRTYDLDPAEYDALLAWQGGRCYICGQKNQKRRLAVDHDHVTGEVRGLLCSADEWGCNVSLRRLLNSLDMATRALAYVQMSPLQRLRAGQSPASAAS